MLAGLLLAVAASAQQPLEVFVAGAADTAIDLRVASADVQGAKGASQSSLGALTPRVSLQGGYTRNQQAVEFGFPDDTGEIKTVTISGLDQLDASARVEMPLIDLAAWSRWAAAGADVKAARERAAAADRDTTLRVTQAWFDLVAARAVHDAAVDALQTAEKNLDVVAARRQGGLSSDLDLERSRSDLALAQESIAVAQLDEVLAERRLTLLTGVKPDAKRAELTSGLGEEAELDAWLARAGASPDVRAAEASVRAAKGRRVAAGTSLAPSINGFAQERWTTAAGFGPNALWSAGVVARWDLDLSRTGAAVEAGGALARARALEDAARQDEVTAVVEAWYRVQSLSARVVATTARAEASQRAAGVAVARLEAGVGSQLDVSIAQRDSFQANVDRTRAMADLHVQRRALRLSVGLPPDLSVQP